MLSINRVFFYHIFLILIITFSIGCSKHFDPKKATNSKPLDLSNVALINEVWYEDDQQYVHSSFTYAGTGFLINTAQGVLAATAKHVLMIANPKGMKGVSPNIHLEKWVMHPKQNALDSVILGQLLNEDKEEMLGFGNASIQLRDWIVFATQYHSPNIQKLTPRFTQLKVGETIYFTGCPYKKENCIIEKATVLSVKGNRIVFSKEDQTANIGGASGSPLIDAEGKLVGILSGTSVSPKNGDNALFGISTHYLKKILKGDKDLNKTIIPIDQFLKTTIAEKGVDEMIQQYQSLKVEPSFYFDYFVSPEGINRIADEFLETGQIEEALKILALSEEEHAFFSNTYTLFGKAYLAQKEPISAKKALTEALRLWPENEAAQELMRVLGETN